MSHFLPQRTSFFSQLSCLKKNVGLGQQRKVPDGNRFEEGGEIESPSRRLQKAEENSPKMVVLPTHDENRGKARRRWGLLAIMTQYLGA